MFAGPSSAASIFRSSAPSGGGVSVHLYAGAGFQQLLVDVYMEAFLAVS